MPRRRWRRIPEFCATLDQAKVDGTSDFAAIYRACVAQLDAASLVLAVLDGADGDSGTAWEMGYACARGIPIVGLRTDWRPAEDGAGNCMLSRSCVAITADIAAAADAIAALLAKRG